LTIKTRYITSGWAGSSCRGSEVYYETATEKLSINFAALLERSRCWQIDQNHILTVVDIDTVEVGRPLLDLELAKLLVSAKFRRCIFSLLFSFSLLVIYYTRSKELLTLLWKELGFRQSGQLGWSESFRELQENVLDPDHKEWFNIDSKQIPRDV
jgi:hypothetical protein